MNRFIAQVYKKPEFGPMFASDCIKKNSVVFAQFTVSPLLSDLPILKPRCPFKFALSLHNTFQFSRFYYFAFAAFTCNARLLFWRYQLLFSNFTSKILFQKII